jgi:hypothetical protein
VPTLVCYSILAGSSQDGIDGLHTHHLERDVNLWVTSKKIPPIQSQDTRDGVSSSTIPDGPGSCPNNRSEMCVGFIVSFTTAISRSLKVSKSTSLRNVALNSSNVRAASYLLR